MTKSPNIPMETSPTTSAILSGIRIISVEAVASFLSCDPSAHLPSGQIRHGGQ